jgi:hypothetical protein
MTKVQKRMTKVQSSRNAYVSHARIGSALEVGFAPNWAAISPVVVACIGRERRFPQTPTVPQPHLHIEQILRPPCPSPAVSLSSPSSLSHPTLSHLPSSATIAPPLLGSTNDDDTTKARSSLEEASLRTGARHDT